MLNFDKHYNSARKMVGASGPDLVHHCYLLVHDKLTGVEYPDTYFHRIMINQLSAKDKWRRLEAAVHPKVTMCRIDGHDRTNLSEYVLRGWSFTNKGSTGSLVRNASIQPHEEHQDEWSKMDTVRLEAILNDLRHEGYAEEIDVFMRKVKGQTVKSISEATGVCRATLADCIEFVRTTVKERYEHHTH